MVRVRCEDGSVLDVVPVPVRDRAGDAYETTLRLLRDDAPFGEVGERCHGVLRALAARLEADDDVVGTAEDGVRRWAAGAGADPDAVWSQLRPHLPREAELLDLRARDPDDVTSAGELRAVLRTRRTWGERGWTARTQVVLQAWGDDGTAVRALLDVDGLRALVRDLLAEAGRQAAPPQQPPVRAPAQGSGGAAPPG